MARHDEISFEDFDPNAPSSTQPVWAVYTPGTFKTYPGRGHAINRFHHHSQAKLYEWDLNADRWVERAVKGAGKLPVVCDGCRQTTIETRPRRNYQRQPSGAFAMVNTGQTYDYNTGVHQFERQSGKISNPVTLLFLCASCADVNKHA